jgi:hypothetical protein
MQQKLMDLSRRRRTSPAAGAQHRRRGPSLGLDRWLRPSAVIGALVSRRI